MSTGLSERARQFIQEHGTGAARASFGMADLGLMFPTLRRDPHLVAAMDPAFVALLPTVVEFERTYGGLTVPVVGGSLEGEIRLGLHGVDPVWRASDGRLVYRGARHPTAQCTLLFDSNGRFGTAWHDEFNVMLDSVELVLEQAAAWAALHGWSHSAIVTGAEVAEVVRAVGGLSLDGDASGELSQWWSSDDLVAVSSYGLDGRGRAPASIHLVARAAAQAREIRAAITGHGLTVSGYFVGRFERVPQLVREGVVPGADGGPRREDR